MLGFYTSDLKPVRSGFNRNVVQVLHVGQWVGEANNEVSGIGVPVKGCVLAVFRNWGEVWINQ